MSVRASSVAPPARRVATGLVAAALSVAASDARAGGSPGSDNYDDVARDAPLDVRGFADLYALHDVGGASSGTVALRAFDVHRDTPSVGLARVTLAHRPRVFGFRVDLAAGDTVDAFVRQDPSAVTAPALARAFASVPQAFATLALPVAGGLALDVGRFATPMGLEDNESLTNWNQSRSYLYTWAEPSLHTGARANLRLSPVVALAAYWVNGWNTAVLDGNAMRTVAAGIALRPSDAFELDAVFMAGLERAPTHLADAALAWRGLLCASATYAPPWLHGVSLALALDRGQDASRVGAVWFGLAAYARVRLRPWLAASARAELLADPSGFVTATAQTLAETTLTLEAEHHVGPRLRLLARLEYRHDQSTAAPFDAASGGARGQQDTLTVGLLAAF